MKPVAEVGLFDSGAWIRISDERGNAGVGEASPLPGRSRETTAQALAALRAARFELLADPRETLGSISVETASARFAVETALLDLLEKRTGKAAWQLLGGHGTRVPLNALVTGVDDATRAAARGIRTLKAKLGAPIEAIHAALPGLALRLDANGRLARDASLPSWLEYVEQPFPSLRGARLSVPIAADESVLEEPDVALDVASVLVLKPTILGGWLATLDLASRGRAAVITHAMEGRVARGACASLALALPAPPLACGLDDGTNAWIEPRSPEPLAWVAR